MATSNTATDNDSNNDTSNPALASITPQSLNIAAQAAGLFIHAGWGGDAVAAYGGTGPGFLAGGAGPTLGAAGSLSASPGTTNPTVFGFTGRIVDYTVPQDGTYRIVADGAQGGTEPHRVGGNATGGDGAQVGADFGLKMGDVLQIAVGGKGGNGPSSAFQFGAGGGGGGTFVVGPGGSPLLIAGGGGGGGGSLGAAGLSVSGTAAQSGDGDNGGAGGSAGSGGSGGNFPGGGNGGGGGGFVGNGSNGSPPGKGGSSFADGLGGGGSGTQGGGGFGGGGGGGNDVALEGPGGGGGGGGYSGGGGGGSGANSIGRGGGSGGSFFGIGATDPSFVVATGGDGSATITRL